jgi:hypothetical protein
MPLRSFQTIDTERRGSVTEEEPVGQPSSVPEKRSFWRTSLLLATSAALGGIAVAIWNRRTLAQMRQQIDPHDHLPWSE